MGAIEIGTTSVRMAIGEVIAKGSFETCVTALRNFQAVLREYAADTSPEIRAVATSAVREASNREAFLDRVYVATGLDVEVLEAFEVRRFTYLAIHPILETTPEFQQGNALALEIGGGSTEALFLRQGMVESADVYRLGSLRLRRTLAHTRAPRWRLREMMEIQVDRTLAQVRARQNVPADGSVNLLALGGDARFACARLNPGWTPKVLGKISVSTLAGLADKLLLLPVEEVVRLHQLPYPDAETLGPALLALTRIAHGLGTRQIFVTGATLRDGILAELSHADGWVQLFDRQVVRSAMEIGKRYGFDAPHAEYTAHLAGQLFDGLMAEHGLDRRHTLVLTVAAWLHEIDWFVSTSSHHKHSQYLIQNSDLFGLSRRNLTLAALVARYHRRALPSSTHEVYRSLSRADRVTVCKLAAILRVADALAKGTARIPPPSTCASNRSRWWWKSRPPRT